MGGRALATRQSPETTVIGEDELRGWVSSSNFATLILQIEGTSQWTAANDLIGRLRGTYLESMKTVFLSWVALKIPVEVLAPDETECAGDVKHIQKF